MSLVIVAMLVLDVGVLAAQRSRNRFIGAGGTFRCRFRACGQVSPIWPGLARHSTRRWSRPMWARWAEDVLIVRRGPLLPRIISVRAQMCRAGVYDMPPDDPGGFGYHPIAAGLRLCDGSTMEVVTAGGERLALVGPYLAAAVDDVQHIASGHTGSDAHGRRPDDQD